MGNESLRPREHGAYGQLGFPLVTALALGSPGIAAWAFALAAIALFVAHEPLLVVGGLRGARKRRELGPQAWRRLVALGALAVLLGVLGWWLSGWTVRWSTLVPSGLALITFRVASTGKERTLPGLLLASAALVSASVPVALAAAVPASRVVMLTGVWISGFWLTTVAVRGVAWRRRDGGRMLRVASVAAASVLLAVVAGLAWQQLPWWAAAALGPTWLAVVAIVWRAPPPQAMPRVGWSLVAASTATLLVLLVAYGR